MTEPSEPKLPPASSYLDRNPDGRTVPRQPPQYALESFFEVALPRRAQAELGLLPPTIGELFETLYPIPHA